MIQVVSLWQTASWRRLDRAIRWGAIVVWVVGSLGVHVVPASAAPPDSVRQSFEAGNRAYAQGRYREAVEAYQKASASGYASAALHYNLGNAYFRLDAVGRAIRQYETARRLRPGDPRLDHNLEQARERVVGPGATPPPPRGWGRLVDDWPTRWIFGVGWLLIVAGGVVAVVRARPDASTPWTHPLVASLVVAGAIVAATAMAGAYAQTLDTQAVVVADRVPLRSAPADTSVADTTVHEGATVHVVRRDDGWTEVRLAPALHGWIPSSSLAIID